MHKWFLKKTLKTDGVRAWQAAQGCFTSTAVPNEFSIYLGPFNRQVKLELEKPPKAASSVVLNGSGKIVLVLLTSLNCCMSTFHLIHYTLLLTPACWKSNNTNARLMASTLSLALDPTFGIHSHKTLDTAQPCHLLKPNWKPSSSHSISKPNENLPLLTVFPS